ncbi:MAG: acyltransferase [Myxococcaceae bacterium]|nr:MAG: acyltransferase [Myxococcaceae bacterium]
MPGDPCHAHCHVVPEPLMSTSVPARPILERLDFLDALRGLAAAYVVVYHMVAMPQPAMSTPVWADKFAHSGGNGVVMFFLVSAFSLCYTMPLREADPKPLASFYLHRFFRIAPLFYVFLLLTLVRDLLLFDASHSPTSVLASMAFVFNLIPGWQEGIVWASWTIGIEMLFYAVFPLVHRRVGGPADAIAFFFLSVLAWMAFQLILEYLVIPAEWKASINQWFALKHFPTFALGMVVYFLFMRMRDVRARPQGDTPGLGGMLIACGIFVYCAMLQGWLPAIFGTAYGWNGIACALLALGLAARPTAILVNRVTLYLGKVSYSLYLVHPTVVFLLMPVYRRIHAQSGSLSLSFLLCLLLTFAVCLPLASLAYAFVEKPGIRYGRRLARYWGVSREPSSPGPP